MPFSASADSSRAQLSYVAETVVGTTPSNPVMQQMRMTGESLNGSRASSSSAEIRADRNTADLVTTAETSSGEINIELSPGSYDEFLAAALQGSWTSSVLKNGTTRKSFSILKQFTDVNKSFLFKGCEVSTLSLNMAQGGFVTGSFGIMSRGNTETLPAGVTYTAAGTTPVFNLTQHMSPIAIGGQSANGVQSFSLALNNNAREQRQIGSKDLAGVGMGTLSLTGSITVYFQDASAINAAYDSDSAVPLSFSLTNAGGGYDFLLPAVKFSNRTIVAGAINQDVVMTLQFTATYDELYGAMIQIGQI
jgi:hypothetical protein